MITASPTRPVAIISERTAFGSDLGTLLHSSGTTRDTVVVSYAEFANAIGQSRSPARLVLIDLTTSSDLSLRGAFDVTAQRLPVSFVFLIDPASRRCCPAFFDLACRMGAIGCLSATASTESIATSLLSILRGFPQAAPEFSELLKVDSTARCLTPRHGTALDGLTLRQLEVMTLLAKGHNVRCVAVILRLSAKTVESHKYRLMKELGIENAVSLCRFAIRHGLVEP